MALANHFIVSMYKRRWCTRRWKAKKAFDLKERALDLTQLPNLFQNVRPNANEAYVMKKC